MLTKSLYKLLLFRCFYLSDHVYYRAAEYHYNVIDIVAALSFNIYQIIIVTFYLDI